MKIHTYCDDTIQSREPQAPLVDLWARSWAKRGWTPVILSPLTARKHPRFEMLTAHAKSQHRGPNDFAYDLACLHRWLALDVAGGGFLSDYDVWNFSLRPLPPRELDFEILTGIYCPCFVYANPAGLKWFVDQILAYRSDGMGREANVPDGWFFDQGICHHVFRGRSPGEAICFPSDQTTDGGVIHFANAYCNGDRLKALANFHRKLDC